MKHRILFMVAWTALAALLFIFPGFEIRSLVMGLIVGYWPTLFFTPLYECQFHHPFILLLLMFFLSGATVLLCAWLMDKLKIGKVIKPLLAIAMIAGAAYFATHSISYESWKRTPAISAAMESPEISYQPSRRDFNEAIIIPRILVGSLWGLYLTAGIGALLATTLLMKILCRAIRNPKSTPNPGDLHGRSKT